MFADLSSIYTSIVLIPNFDLNNIKTIEKNAKKENKNIKEVSVKWIFDVHQKLRLILWINNI